MAAPHWRTVFIGSAAVFLTLALLAYFWGLLPGEQALYHVVIESASPRTVSIFHGINYLGDKRVLIPATLLLLWLAPREARRRWWLWVGAIVVGAILEGLGKELIGRPRPEGDAFGFPSGHVTAAGTYFFLAAYLAGKRLWNPGGPTIILWVGAGLAVSLVGAARVLLHAHWPADVLGGAALALACVSLAAWWHERATGA